MFIKRLQDNTVEVYKNSHKDTWSVRWVKTGKVEDPTDSLFLSGARLVVQPAGREKVLKEHSKNVHASVKGVRLDFNPYTDHLGHKYVAHKKAHYDPDRYPYFYVDEND